MTLWVPPSPNLEAADNSEKPLSEPDLLPQLTAALTQSMVSHSSAVTSRGMLTPKKSTTQGVAMAKEVSAIDARSMPSTLGHSHASAKPRDCGSATS